MAPTTVQLRKYREAKGLTQLQLAELVGVRQATISDIEKGKAKVIRLTLIEALTRVLDVSLSELIVVEPDAPAKPVAKRKRGRG